MRGRHKPGKRQDHYFRKAKAEKYLARSVYKIQEIDARFRILKPGQVVLDLGAAPGSWVQYAAHKVAPGGRVIALDRKPLAGPLPHGVTALQADLLEVVAAGLPGVLGIDRVDVLLSDMAPSTSGHKEVDHFRSMALCRAAFEAAEQVLQPGGAWVCKAFQGVDLEPFVRDIRGRFGRFKRVKPKSSRKESVEIFLVGTGFHGGGGARSHPGDAEATTLSSEENQDDGQGHDANGPQ